MLCPLATPVDQTFLIEVPFPSDAREVLRRCVVNNLRNSAPKLGKDFYAQKN